MRIQTLVTLLLIAPPALAGDASAPAPTPAPLIRHDPFRAPSGAAQAPDVPAAAPVEVWAPRLRGILHAGRGSLANVDGQLVAVGESLDGHRLLSVSDYQAIFEKNGRRVILDMRRPQESRP